MKFNGKFLNGQHWTKQAHVLDLICRQLGPSVPLPRRHRSVCVLISRVVFACAPRKVCETIINRVAVHVARLMVFGTLASEGFKDKAMNILHEWLLVLPQNYLDVSGTLFFHNVHDALSPLAELMSIRPAGPHFSICCNGISRESVAVDKVFSWQLRQIHSCDVITGSLV